MRIHHAVAVLFVLFVTASALAETIPDRNVNMVAGTGWPDGDPFLQRQNEPSLAVSTTNPLHLLAAANDYRAVDIPGLPDIKVMADAWMGIFRSYDGGTTWKSTLLPGYLQDTTPEGTSSPIHGFQAAADPVVRAGPNGMFYVTGIVLNREENTAGAFFVARYLDHTDKEAGHSIRYIDTQLIDTGTSGQFLDKPWIAVDVPRGDTQRCTVGGPESFAAGNVYAAYSRFVGNNDVVSKILFTRSTDCGAAWSKPIKISESSTVNQATALAIDPVTGRIYIVWRRFRTSSQGDAIMAVKSDDFGATFTKPAEIASIHSFDQGTDDVPRAFRTNSYPSIAVDPSGRAYVVWTQRNANLDARVVITSSSDGVNWSTPVPIDDHTYRGHQFMPTIAYSGGKITVVYYDLREDHTTGLFTPRPGEPGFYDESRRPEGHLAAGQPGQVFNSLARETATDLTPLLRRRTLDVRVTQTDAGVLLGFPPSVRLTQYKFGSRPGNTLIEQLQMNPPNLPLFRQGTVPFMGDYIDVAGEMYTSTGAFKSEISRAPVFHAVWADNRDVRPPHDGDWTKYVPVNLDNETAQPRTSTFDGTTVIQPCNPATDTLLTGMRNQNIYTSRITRGLFAGSPGNVKPTLTPEGVPLERAFVVFAQNTRNQLRSYRLTIRNQPPEGRASFLQVPKEGFPFPLLSVDVAVPARSTVSRSVFVRSPEMFPIVSVDIEEISTPDGVAIDGGLATTVVLNPDIANPDIANPDIANPDIANPDIANAEVYNPDIANPDIANPDIANPDIANPDIANPDIANPDIANPDIANPDIANPDIANPDIANPDIANPDIANQSMTDTTWRTTNEGNTAASFSVNLLLNGQEPPANAIVTQLIIHRTYSTPAARNCELGTEEHTVIEANIPRPDFITDPAQLLVSDVTDPSHKNATLWLAPGDSAHVTLRVFDKDIRDGITFNAAEQVTPVVVAHAINTEDLANGITTPPISLTILTSRADDAIAGTSYSFALQAIGGVGEKSWTGGAGLPAGITLGSSGALSGTATSAGDFKFTATVTDSDTPSPNTRTRTIAFRVVEPLAIVDTTLPDATLNTAYSHTFTSSGGVTPFTWSVVAGTLPAGLTLSETGLLQGTPTAVGSSTFTVRVTDGTFPTPQVDDAPLTLEVVVGSRTFVVTNTNDEGAGSLRQAIFDSNANAGFTDTIAFKIDGIAPHVITTASPLPDITDPVLISGNSTGCGAPTVEIDGVSAGAAHGLVVTAGGTTIRGLAITRFASTGFAGIQIRGAGGNVIACNYVGVAPDGVTAKGNGNGIHIIDSAANTINTGNVISANNGEGVRIDGASASANVIQGNYIGTAASGAVDLGNSASGVYIRRAPANSVIGNLISGNDGFAGVAICGSAAFCGGGDVGTQGNNASGNVVQGNLVGTNVTGAAVLGNSQRGVSIDGAPNTIVGGSTPADRNVISGNAVGIVVFATGATANQIAGNYIGTNLDGTAALGNSTDGVLIDGVPNNTIGGTMAGARNVVSGNGQDGIRIVGAGAQSNQLLGNYVGVGASGTAAVPNGRWGISVEGANNTIGAPGTGGNLVSGNVSVGIVIRAGGSGNTIRGNRIGTNAAGTAAVPNSNGVTFNGASSNLVGGTSPGEGNLISGNRLDGIDILSSSGNLVRGNVIGTDASGTAALGNASNGLFLQSASNTTIELNVISGNGAAGVRLAPGTTGTQILGNFIGTNQGGTAAVPNLLDGVLINAGLNTVGAATPGARNVISGNAVHGVRLAGSSATGNVVAGNFIGTTASGDAALGNGSDGVLIDEASGNTLGGDAAGSGNVIAASGQNGVRISGIGATGNVVRGNNIGTTASGTSGLANAFAGVSLEFSASNNTIGGTTTGTAQNVISFSGEQGIRLTGGAGSGNALRFNKSHGNGGLAIDLGGDGVTPNDTGDGDTGPNDLQNFPVLSSVVSGSGTATVAGTLNSTPNTQFIIDFFHSPACDASGFGEGQTWFGAVTQSTDGDGNLAFDASIGISLAAGTVVTALATSPGNNTSEFSACVSVSASQTIDFESPSLGTADSQTLNPFTASGVTFTAEPAGFGDEVVKLVKNTGLGTSACVPAESANQMLGTGREGLTGFGTFEIRATPSTTLPTGTTVSVRLQSLGGETARLRLFDTSGTLVGSGTALLPSVGVCPNNTGLPRGSAIVNATATQPVAYAILDLASASSIVFVIDDFTIR